MTGLRVTDHALVRALERICGLPVEQLRACHRIVARHDLHVDEIGVNLHREQHFMRELIAPVREHEHQMPQRGEHCGNSCFLAVEHAN